ncbi:MAG: hypothetical protein ACTHM8_07560 [Sphingomonas sp.]
MTVGSILRGGFGLIRAQPGLVAIWGALYLAATMLGFVFLMPMMKAMAVTPPNPAAMRPMMGMIWLYDLVLLVVMAVIFAAIFRAVIAPERRGFAYLRVGMDEVRLIGLAFLLWIAAVVAMVVASLLIVLLTAVVGYALGAHGAAVALGIVLSGALGCVAIWLEVRLSIAFPLTLMRGRITIGEAWRLTAGRFWTLFGAYLVGTLIVAILSMIVFWPMLGGYFIDMMHASGDPQRMNAVVQAQVARTIHPGLGMIAMWVLGGVIYAIGLALGGGMLATAAIELAAEGDTPAA